VWWVIFGLGATYHHYKEIEDIKNEDKRENQDRGINNLHYWQSMRL
jgi:hypothetical protein